MNIEQQQLVDQGYAEGKKSFDYLAGLILHSFDFEKVHKAMVFLDWKWYAGKNTYAVPDIDTLKDQAMRLLKDAYDNEKAGISCGGLMGGWDGGNLWLTFQIEESHTSDF